MYKPVKSRWTDFMTDVGDTIGGIFVGIAFTQQNLTMLIIGAIMIITSIYLEYFKKGKQDGEQTSKMG